MTTFKKRLLAHSVKLQNGCLQWTGCTNEDGYGLIGGPRIAGKPVARKTHRVAYEVFVGPITNGLSVLHKCDNHACINPKHLYLGTQAQNIRDMSERNQARWNPLRKLTDHQVRSIRASSETQRVLGERYGIAQCCIAFIRTGRTYRHIQ